MPKHHYQQYGTIEKHIHHVHTPWKRQESQYGPRGGDFWGDVGNFFTHTLPEFVEEHVVPVVAAMV